MMPEMGHPEPRLEFKIGPRQTATDCPRFCGNLREIMGNPCASKLAPFCRIIEAKDFPNFG